LKEEDRENVEKRLEALALLYKILTNRILSFEFVKRTEEGKKKKKKEKKEGKKSQKKQPKGDAKKE